jgi:hypothetical protein
MAEASKKSLFFRLSKRSDDIDSEAISAFFSSIGPIRSCFQVTKDGTRLNITDKRETSWIWICSVRDGR